VEGPAAAELNPPAAVTRRGAGTWAAARAVVSRPRLWPAALRQVRALVPARWWCRRPFLPVPDRDWLRFRMTTAYGDPAASVDVGDLLTWLAWTDTTRPAPPAGGAGRR
jgi:hypothetical protein